MHLSASNRRVDRWRHLVTRLLEVVTQAWLTLHTAQQLNILDKDVTKQEHPQVLGAMSKAKAKAKQRSQKSTGKQEAEAYQQSLMDQCSHMTFKRHGNRHGSFATCQSCKARWKWEDGGWRLHGGSSNYSLPLPSFLTTTDGSIKPPEQPAHPSMMDYFAQYHAQAPPAASSQMPYPPQVLQSAGPAPSQPTGIRIMEVDKQTWHRQRPLSMTSSAAGHGRRVEEMQDMDTVMKNQPPPISIATEDSFSHLESAKD